MSDPPEPTTAQLLRWGGRDQTPTEAATLRVALPYPPSVNHLYSRWRGRVVKSAVGRRYALRCAEHVWAARLGPPRWVPPERLSIEVHVHPPDRRRRDLDNILKALGDAVAAGLGIDDARIDAWRVVRGEPHRPHGRLELLISPAPGA